VIAVEATARHRNDRSKNLVGFLVGEVHYAVNILRVREIINPLPLVSLPHAPPVVVGVADHRGEVVPVIDLRRRFGLPAKQVTRRTKWIVVEGAERSVGLVVDCVTDVFGAGASAERSVPKLGAGDEARGLASAFVHDGSLIFVIDVDLVAAPAESVDIAAAGPLMEGPVE
jgi:purine-binding chemotaxis protein CheW